MESKKQTAVEWLEDKLDIILPLDFEWDKLNNILQQAKQMEKQQIIDAYLQGQYDGDTMRDTDAEQYYTKTFTQ